MYFKASFNCNWSSLSCLVRLVVLVVTWYNWHDHHVEHVVEEQGDADGDEHELPLVLGLLHDNGLNNKEQKVYMSLG